MSEQPPNFAGFVFLDPRAEAFYADLDASKDLLVAVLRVTAGRDPLDKRTTDLIGELSARSADFAARWARHAVRRHSRGRKVIHHPAVGTLDLAYTDFDLPGDPNVSVVTYTARRPSRARTAWSCSPHLRTHRRPRPTPQRPSLTRRATPWNQRRSRRSGAPHSVPGIVRPLHRLGMVEPGSITVGRIVWVRT